MTVTKTNLIKILGNIKCVVETIESGDGIMYLGTDKGIIYRYNSTTGAMTKSQVRQAKILCGVYDGSTYIYFGTDKGKIIRYTVSGGAVSDLYKEFDRAIVSIDYYSSYLWVGLSNGQFAKVSVS